MKFWKQLLLVIILLCGVTTTLLYTSCVKNVCDNVTCQNGGSCNAGVCNCPVGYEDPQCQTLSVTRYLGTYVGSTSCDNLVGTIDTVNINAFTGLGITGVEVHMNSLFPSPPNKGLLYGTVSSNVTTYSILVTNPDTTTQLYRTYTITLQDDNALKITEYIRDYRNPADSIVSTCIFTGYKD
jgi:hypothetical protein